MIAEQDIPTPITDAAESTMFPDGSKWVTAEFARKLERQLADAREQRDRLAEVVKSRDADRVYNDRKWNELREQRDRLAEAVEFVLEDSELTNGHFWPDVVAKCRAALAAVKGDSK